MHANIESAIVIDYFWYVISNNLNIGKNPYRYTSTALYNPILIVVLTLEKSLVSWGTYEDFFHPISVL